MKTKLLSIFVAATAALSSTSHAAILSLAGIANTTVGLVTLDPTGEPVVRGVVSGRAIFVSTTGAMTGVFDSMDTLLQSATSAPGAFDAALTALIGSTSSTDPGIVRSTTFTSGLLASTGTVEMGASGNSTYLFLVAEAGGYITGIGAYTGSAVPTSGSVTFNPSFAGDSLLVGTSVLAAAAGGQPISGFQLASAVPEPSAAILGALGALGLLRRRRI